LKLAKEEPGRRTKNGARSEILAETKTKGALLKDPIRPTLGWKRM
jgi:hypothetical protein